MANEAKPYSRSDEDVLSYALFPAVALEYFKERVMIEKGANVRDLAAIATMFVLQSESKMKAKHSEVCEEANHWKVAARRESLNGGGWIL